MQQKSSDQRRFLLEYQGLSTPRVSNRAAWIEVFALGVPAGYLLSFSSYGFVCAGIFFGAIIGFTTALTAGSHRILFGLLGNSVAIFTCLFFAVIRNFRGGTPIEMDTLVEAVLLMSLVVAGPGLFCGAFVWRIKTPIS